MSAAVDTRTEVLSFRVDIPEANIDVTTDIYGHWERAERKLQAAKMEDAFPV
jgi:hypothetical protein